MHTWTFDNITMEMKRVFITTNWILIPPPPKKPKTILAPPVGFWFTLVDLTDVANYSLVTRLAIGQNLSGAPRDVVYINKSVIGCDTVVCGEARDTYLDRGSPLWDGAANFLDKYRHALKCCLWLFYNLHHAGSSTPSQKQSIRHASRPYFFCDCCPEFVAHVKISK